MNAGKPSKLELLSLGLEYNESWADARRKWNQKFKSKKRNTRKT